MISGERENVTMQWGNAAAHCADAALAIALRTRRTAWNAGPIVGKAVLPGGRFWDRYISARNIQRSSADSEFSSGDLQIVGADIQRTLDA